MTPLIVIIIYLSLLLGLGFVSKAYFRGTSKDFFVASHSIGPFLLLMSVFGTTMTAFALIGSTGKAFQRGIGTYGLMASSSGLIHALCFYLIGIRLWAIGKRYGYVTQIQFFRNRFESNGLGYLLFPVLVGLLIPYLLIGVMGSYKVMIPMTRGLFPDIFASTGGSLPKWLIGGVICGVVLTYVFGGGSRSAAWANTFQTLVFIGMGIVAFFLIAHKLGGLSEAILQANPDHLVRTPAEVDITKGGKVLFTRHVGIPPLMFLSYMFIPLSVGMFPHLFQHWLTARSAKTFRLTVIAHPLCIMIVWVPCVLIGVWATGTVAGMPPLPDEKVGAVLSIMVKKLIGNEIIVGLVTAGILAAIMSSLDSQFLCLGTIFTNDIVLHTVGKDRFTDRQIVSIARWFIIGIVLVTYLCSLKDMNVFDLAVWSFSGFASLTPLVFGALYWRRATRMGAYASVIAAMVVWFFFFWKSGFGGEYTVLGGIMPVTFSFTASAVALVLVSLCTEPPKKETVDKFFPSKNYPI